MAINPDTGVNRVRGGRDFPQGPGRQLAKPHRPFERPRLSLGAVRLLRRLLCLRERLAARLEDALDVDDHARVEKRPRAASS